MSVKFSAVAMPNFRQGFYRNGGLDRAGEEAYALLRAGILHHSDAASTLNEGHDLLTITLRRTQAAQLPALNDPEKDTYHLGLISRTGRGEDRIHSPLTFSLDELRDSQKAADIGRSLLDEIKNASEGYRKYAINRIQAFITGTLS